MRIKCTKYNRRIRNYNSSKGPNDNNRDKLKRAFRSNRRYQKIAFNITKLKTHNDKKVYIEIIKDLATRQIFTWSVSQHPNLQFALTLLHQMLKSPTGYQLILHTKQG